ncbi:MAG: hypothetical protein AAF623_14010 [Planctomycetota bacterium]
MIRFQFNLIAVAFCLFAAIHVAYPVDANGQSRKLILVVGADGQEEYGKQFRDWASNWRKVVFEAAAKSITNDSNAESDQDSQLKSNGKEKPQAGPDLSKPDSSRIELVEIGIAEPGEKSDLEQLEQAIVSTDSKTVELWLILIGHGTDDRKLSKFNLRGRDLTASQLNQWLANLKNRVVVVNCASASAGFISKLKAPNRVVITSTKSPSQYNFSRFGKYLAESIADPTLDLDKDQQTSLLEAFIAASARTQEFYTQETRLATELAIIDDNGDGKGTPGDWFEGTRVGRQSKSGVPDGIQANQIFLVRRGAEAKLTESERETRDQLEAELEKWRAKKSRMDEATYYKSIEPILIRLAKLYSEVEGRGSDPADMNEPESEAIQKNQDGENQDNELTNSENQDSGREQPF